LVGCRIQTPSGITVRSAVQPEGEVVLGASPPARSTSSPESERSGFTAPRASAAWPDGGARPLSSPADGGAPPAPAATASGGATVALPPRAARPADARGVRQP